MCIDENGAHSFARGNKSEEDKKHHSRERERHITSHARTRGVPKRVAEADPACGLDRGVDVEAAGQLQRLVGHKRHRLPLHATKALRVRMCWCRRRRWVGVRENTRQWPPRRQNKTTTKTILHTMTMFLAKSGMISKKLPSSTTRVMTSLMSYCQSRNTKPRDARKRGKGGG